LAGTRISIGKDTAMGLINIGFFIWALGLFLAPFPRQTVNYGIFSKLLLAGSILILSGCVAAWPNSFDWQAPAPLYLYFTPFALHLDPLATIFLALLGTICAAVALFSPGYLARMEDHCNMSLYWTTLFLFVSTMGGVILSANALTFLVCWELMSLSSVALVASDHARLKARRAAMIYLGATRIASAFILGSFLWMHYIFNSWNFIDWKLGTFESLFPAILLFIGLAIKAGIFPFHLWLPYAHTEAPATVSALMSGVMVKVALYAMIRILIFGGAEFQSLGYIALVLGTLSSVLGVVFALTQSDMKRMLAFHTVENVGLVLMGIAVAMLSKSGALHYAAAIALASAIFHSINHGLYKGLLFLGAGSVDARAHTRDMGMLGGLAKKMPWTTACFLVGALSITNMPPFNGFASKWLLYQGLFQLSQSNAVIVERCVSLVTIGIMALVGGLALACFSKAVGISYLGRARSAQAAAATEGTKGMVAGQLILVTACVFLGLFVPVVLHLLNHAVRVGVGSQIDIGYAFPVHMKLLVVMGAGIVAVVMLWLKWSERKAPVRTYVTWDCGYGPLMAPGRAEETSKSFSQPIARIFGVLFGYHIDLEIAGKDRRHFPEHVKAHIAIASLLEQKLYGPIVMGLDRLSRSLAGIQSGSIHLYLLYVFVTLLILVAVGTRI
jgi:hydrogenase-4 component B